MFPDTPRSRTTLLATWLLATLATPYLTLAQPRSGDVFREYRWTNTEGDAGGSLRVGGKVGYGGGEIPLPHSLDLDHATRAEVVIEKLLCHAGTRGLEISVNGHPSIAAAESDEIPEPQWEYQHHIYPVCQLPLEQLQRGTGNHFRLRVDTEHPWNWPQNLIYGVHFRIYYDPQKKPHAEARLVAPASGSKLHRKVTLEVTPIRAGSDIRQVDFLGLYDGVNLEGDGRYRQWHYHYVRAKLDGHIGSLTAPPWKLEWDTSWIPDQQQAIELGARITDSNGITFQTETVSDLSFDRDGLFVELCKPFDVPQQWVTRSGEHSEKFRVKGDLTKAVAAQLVWCSWSPGYMEGLYINGRKVFQREGPRYAYYVHHVPLDDLSVLRPGENRLTTGKTPKYNGKMVHGMEVNWPGIMVLIQYER